MHKFQALKHLKEYISLFKIFTTNARSELVLCNKVKNLSAILIISSKHLFSLFADSRVLLRQSELPEVLQQDHPVVLQD